MLARCNIVNFIAFMAILPFRSIHLHFPQNLSRVLVVLAAASTDPTVISAAACLDATCCEKREVALRNTFGDFIKPSPSLSLAEVHCNSC